MKSIRKIKSRPASERKNVHVKLMTGEQRVVNRFEEMTGLIGEVDEPEQDTSSSENETAPESAREAEDDRNYADVGLAVYLQQMGSIPMLTRQQEIALAARLDKARQRYRLAAFWNSGVLAQAIEAFERIRAGGMGLERNIDVVPSLGLTAEPIRKRLSSHLDRLLELRQETARIFERLMSATTRTASSALRRTLRCRIRESIRLVEELSPRIELIDTWVDHVKCQSARMRELTEQ